MYDEPPCIDWAEKLATRDNDLSPDDRDALHKHLQTCPACAAAAADYAFLSARLSALPPPAMKPFPRLARATDSRKGVGEEQVALPARASSSSAPSSLRPASAVAANTVMPDRFTRGTHIGGVVVLMLVASALLFHIVQIVPGPSSWSRTHTIPTTFWSPNELQIVTPNIGETIEVWSAVTGRHVFTFHGQTGPVSAVAWSPDGTRIALAGTTDQTVQIWNTVTGKHLLSYYGHSGPVYALAWSPNGEYIASGGEDQTVQVWNAATGAQRVIYAGHRGPVYTIAWSPDGTRIASAGDDQTVQVWKAFTGLRLLIYYGHTAPVSAVAWSPDGKHIASASVDQTVQTWNSSTGIAVSIYHGHSGPVFAIAWSPDGTRIASAGDDQTVQISNAFTGSRLLTYHGHTAPVFTVAWSPNGQQIASEGTDQTIQVWDVDNGKLTQLFMLARS